MKSPVWLCDALISAQVPGDKARAAAEALESDMSDHLATKKDMEAGFVAVRKDVEHLGDRLTLRFIGFTTVSLGLLFAALRYLP